MKKQILVLFFILQLLPKLGNSQYYSQVYLTYKSGFAVSNTACPDFIEYNGAAYFTRNIWDYSSLPEYNDLIKINISTGDTIWTRKFGTANMSLTDAINNMCLFNNTIYILGFNYTTQPYVISFDTLGNILDTVFITSSNGMMLILNSIHIEENGNMVFSGAAIDTATSYDTRLVMRTDPNGNILQEVLMPKGTTSSFLSLEPTGDGDFVGSSMCINTSDGSRAEILKIDSLFNPVWAHLDSNYYTNTAYSRINKAGMTLVYGKCENVNTPGVKDFHRLLDKNGNTVFYKEHIWPGTNTVLHAMPLTDSLYALLFMKYVPGGYNTYIEYRNYRGDSLTSTTLPLISDSYVSRILPLSENNIFIGSTYNWSMPFRTFKRLVKLNCYGVPDTIQPSFNTSFSNQQIIVENTGENVPFYYISVNSQPYQYVGSDHPTYTIPVPGAGVYPITIKTLNCNDTTEFVKDYIVYPENILNGSAEHAIIPNPGSGYLYVWDMHAEPKSIIIYDMNGKTVLTTSVGEGALQTGYTIYTPGLQKATYLVRVKGAQESWESKWLKTE